MTVDSNELAVLFSHSVTPLWLRQI